MRNFVIVNSQGELFSGGWSQITWTLEYPDARIYNSLSIAKREASRLGAEENLSVRVIENYGLDTEREA